MDWIKLAQDRVQW